VSIAPRPSLRWRDKIRVGGEYRALGTTAGAYDEWHEWARPGRESPPRIRNCRRGLDPVIRRAQARELFSRDDAGDTDDPRAPAGKTHVHISNRRISSARPTSEPPHGARGRSPVRIGFQDREICEGDVQSNLGRHREATGDQVFGLISFVDPFWPMRGPKIVPASAIDAVAKSGADSPVSRAGTT